MTSKFSTTTPQCAGLNVLVLIRISPALTFVARGVPAPGLYQMAMIVPLQFVPRTERLTGISHGMAIATNCLRHCHDRHQLNRKPEFGERAGRRGRSFCAPAARLPLTPPAPQAAATQAASPPRHETPTTPPDRSGSVPPPPGPPLPSTAPHHPA